jgi:hypothetical protein
MASKKGVMASRHRLLPLLLPVLLLLLLLLAPP